MTSVPHEAGSKLTIITIINMPIVWVGKLRPLRWDRLRIPAATSRLQGAARVWTSITLHLSYLSRCPFSFPPKGGTGGWARVPLPWNSACPATTGGSHAH